MQEVGGRIVGGLEYATALFERETVERYLGYFRQLLEGMVAVVSLCCVMMFAFGSPELEGTPNQIYAHGISRFLAAVHLPRGIGMLIFGEEVPQTHVHVVPINSPNELTFAHADASPDFDAIEDAANRLRARLRELGRAEVSD